MSFHRKLFFLALFLIQFFIGQTLKGIEQVAYFQTSKSVNILSAVLSNFGQKVYASFLDVDGLYRIKSYDIKEGELVMDQIFTESSPQKVKPSQIIVNTSGNLLGMQPKLSKITLFDSKGKFLQLIDTFETIVRYVYSPPYNCMFYILQNGKVYWSSFDGISAFTGRLILQDRSRGETKIQLSRDQKFIALSGSNDGIVYIYDIPTKGLLHTYTLSQSQIKNMAWNQLGNKLYVATQTSGLVYELMVFSPYTIREYRYESSGAVNVYHVEYNSNSNQVLIFCYKQFQNIKVLYAFSLGDNKVTYRKNFNYSSVSGSSWDSDDGRYFLDWNSKQIWIKKTIDSCESGAYFDQCLNKCVFCTFLCLNCSTAGCGGCKYNISIKNSTYQQINHTNTNFSINSSMNFPNSSIDPLLNSNNTVNLSKTNNTLIPNNTLPISINSSINNSTGQKFTTNSTINNTINNNIASNTTKNKDQPEQQIKCESSVNMLSNFLKSQAMTAFNKMPGGRRFIKPVLTFFNNLDDFWLYIYHQRNYDFVMNSVFTLIRDVEKQKWELIPYQKIWDFFGFNVEAFDNFSAYKQSYTSTKFFEIEENANGFYVNTANFFQSNMIFTAAMFVGCRLLFFLLFKYKISVFLRKFSFWGYLGIILMEGNLQFASYLMAFQFQWMFSDNFIHKMLTISLVVLFYLIFGFAIGCYFIFQYMYEELSKYFFENFKNSHRSAFYLTTYCGLRNILLGFIHLISFKNYNSKISVLFAIQFAFFIGIAKIISSNKVFKVNCVAWVTALGTLIRLLVIGIFYFEQDTISNEFTSTSQIFLTLIISYFGVGFCGCTVECIKLILDILQLRREKPEQEIKVTFKSSTKMPTFMRKWKHKKLINKDKMKVTIYKYKQLSTCFEITEQLNEDIESMGLNPFGGLTIDNQGGQKKLKTVKFNQQIIKPSNTTTKNHNHFESNKVSLDLQDFDHFENFFETNKVENLQRRAPVLTAFKSNVF